MSTATTAVQSRLRSDNESIDDDDAAAAAATATTASATPQSSSPLELIPRSVLFGNPSYMSPILSPDGKYLAYIAPSTTMSTTSDDDQNHNSGVLNVFVQPIIRTIPTSSSPAEVVTASSSFDPGLSRQVTNDTVRGIRTIRWAENSQQVLYLQDQNGNENFHLYAVNVVVGQTPIQQQQQLVVKARDLTPGDNVKVSNVFTSEHFPNDVLVTTNQRNASQFDVYRCSLLLGDDDDDINENTVKPAVMVEENPGTVVSWGICSTDTNAFTVRTRTIRNAIDSSNTIQIRTILESDHGGVNDVAPQLSEWKDLITYPFGEEGNFIDFIPKSSSSSSSSSDDGDEYGYITSSINRETKALFKMNLHTGMIVGDELAYDPKCDIRGVTLDRTTKAIQAVTFNYARTERIFYNDTYEALFQYWMEHPPPSMIQNDFEVSIVSRTRDETMYIVVYTVSDGPSVYVLYNTNTPNETSLLFVSRPELLPYCGGSSSSSSSSNSIKNTTTTTLQAMEDVRITARDGLELVGYLTRAVSLPTTSTHNNNNNNNNNMNNQPPQPMVLLVHGGPWARDGWGYNAQAQWLSNRGYHVLQVNYRGSTGYGKSFLHKGDGQWGIGTMQHDLTDSVQWAIDGGIADPSKICIYGGSYGGYACLAGLAFTPNLYACGVDIVGPSNVKTLLDSIPPYWGPLRNGMLLKIGNVDDDIDFNERISPLFHIDQMCAPLLIGQGANDPRVKQCEADQIAFGMDDKNIDVEYVLYPDEGHGFVRPNNRIDFNGRAELFLSKHLGGRYEEFVPPKGSTATFPLQERRTRKG